MNFEQQPQPVEINEPIPQEKEEHLTADEITKTFLNLGSLGKKLPGEDPQLQLIISLWLDRKSYRDFLRKKEEEYKEKNNLTGQNKLLYIDVLRKMILKKSPLAEEAVGLAYDHLNSVINKTAEKIRSLLKTGKESMGAWKANEVIDFEKKFLNKVSELRKDLERLIRINYPRLLKEKTKAQTTPNVPSEPKQQISAEGKAKEQKYISQEHISAELEREEELLALGFAKSTGKDYVLYVQPYEKDYGWNDGLGIAKKKFESLGVEVKYPNEAQARQILAGLARDLPVGYKIGCYLEDKGRFMLATNGENGIVFGARDCFNLGSMPKYLNSDESPVPIKAFVIGK